MNLNQGIFVFGKRKIIIVPFPFVVLFEIHLKNKNKIQVNLYFDNSVPITEGLHAYPFDQERPCLCILSEHFCTDVLYCKIIY